jgi:hypothetical protein
VNFYEKKKENKPSIVEKQFLYGVKHSSVENTLTNLTEEIILLSTRRLLLLETEFYIFIENSEFIPLFQTIFQKKTNIIDDVHSLSLCVSLTVSFVYSITAKN